MLGDWGKLIVAKGFKKLPKVQKIARSGHTDRDYVYCMTSFQFNWIGFDPTIKFGCFETTESKPVSTGDQPYSECSLVGPCTCIFWLFNL